MFVEWESYVYFYAHVYMHILIRVSLFQIINSVHMCDGG